MNHSISMQVLTLDNHRASESSHDFSVVSLIFRIIFYLVLVLLFFINFIQLRSHIIFFKVMFRPPPCVTTYRFLQFKKNIILLEELTKTNQYLHSKVILIIKQPIGKYF